ncbi:MAG: hypothetical protein KF678_10940 [Phycisphaeraceae bacterium]|nr:hypothetical protein [Phycisphaeraceae bacterium]
MTTQPNQPNMTNDDLLDSLVITKVKARTRAPGSWVDGTIGGDRFQALVFPEPASDPAFEIEGSNISKFWLADDEGRVVADFDRGWNLTPATEIAKRLTDLLAAGLAETLYG